MGEPESSADEPVLWEGYARGAAPFDPLSVLVLPSVVLFASCLLAAAAHEVLGRSAWLGVPAALVALGAFVLLRHARWRSRRIVVTARSVLVVSGSLLPRRRTYLRAGDEVVRVLPDVRQVAIYGLSDRALVFEGVDPDDAQGIADAFALKRTGEGTGAGSGEVASG